MRWVPRAVQRPHRCAFYPTLGSAQTRGYFKADGAFRDFDGTVYVSVVAAEQMAKMMGMVPKHQVAALDRELKAQQEVNAELGDLVDELSTKLEAVDVLQRPTKKTQKVAA